MNSTVEIMGQNKIHHSGQGTFQWSKLENSNSPVPIKIMNNENEELIHILYLFDLM